MSGTIPPIQGPKRIPEEQRAQSPIAQVVTSQGGELRIHSFWDKLVYYVFLGSKWGFKGFGVISDKKVLIEKISNQKEGLTVAQLKPLSLSQLQLLSGSSVARRFLKNASPEESHGLLNHPEKGRIAISNFEKAQSLLHGRIAAGTEFVLINAFLNQSDEFLNNLSSFLEQVSELEKQKPKQYPSDSIAFTIKDQLDKKLTTQNPYIHNLLNEILNTTVYPDYIENILFYPEKKWIPTNERPYGLNISYKKEETQIEITVEDSEHKKEFKFPNENKVTYDEVVKYKNKEDLGDRWLAVKQFVDKAKRAFLENFFLLNFDSPLKVAQVIKRGGGAINYVTQDKQIVKMNVAGTQEQKILNIQFEHKGLIYKTQLESSIDEIKTNPNKLIVPLENACIFFNDDNWNFTNSRQKEIIDEIKQGKIYESRNGEISLLRSPPLGEELKPFLNLARVDKNTRNEVIEAIKSPPRTFDLRLPIPSPSGTAFKYSSKMTVAKTGENQFTFTLKVDDKELKYVLNFYNVNFDNMEEEKKSVFIEKSLLNMYLEWVKKGI